jgi:hypothetical protein
MTNEEIERERRNGRIAGILGIVGIVLFVGIGAAGLASEFQGADGFAESLVAFPPESNEVVVLLLAQALGIALFAPPLMVLFTAVRNRMDNFRPGLIGLCIAGPLFFAGSLVASYFAIDAAAGLFDPAVDLDPGVELDSGEADDVAEDIYLDQSAANIASGLRFAGQLGLTFIIVYTALYAMRAGLLTRFWGTLSMALGVGVLLIGPPALLGFFLAVSLLVAGFWPGGRPPAWEAGKAIPWPKPGEAPDPEPDKPEELASPEDFEGSATEVEETSERPGRRDNKRKRKRKQR